MKWFYNLCTLILLLYSFMACSTLEEVKTVRHVDNPMFDEYYLNIKGTENRLVALMTGYFSCYSLRKKGLWTVNSGKDSIITHACQIGEPSKDGYWVYQESLMSHLLEEPLDQTLLKIEKQTNDSLTIRVFKVKKGSGDRERLKKIYTKTDRNFNFKNLEEQGCNRTCVKLSQIKFQCQVHNCKNLLNTVTEETWSNRLYNYTPQKIMQESRTFTSQTIQDSSTMTNVTILYLKRLPPKVVVE